MSLTHDALKLKLFKLIEAELGYTLSMEWTIGYAITTATDHSGKGRTEFRLDLQSLRMDLHVVQSAESVAHCIQCFLNKWAPAEKELDVGKALEAGDRTFPTPEEMQLARELLNRVTVGDPKPGMKFDDTRLNYALVDPTALAWLVAGLTYGAAKYNETGTNWRGVVDWRKRYYASLMRHIESWRAGEENDPTTGLPHVVGMMFSAMCLTSLSAPATQQEIEDRTNEAIRRWKSQLPP